MGGVWGWVRVSDTYFIYFLEGVSLQVLALYYYFFLEGGCMFFKILGGFCVSVGILFVGVKH